ncbi:hypothetical protein MXB_2960 [Myxobolus squamalis]|nr:hypothetical protein MXB_2960 [Myxobolus squamalis]
MIPLDEAIESSILLSKPYIPDDRFDRVCLVFFSSKWYRGLVIGKVDSEYSVFLLDIGQTILASLDLLLEISHSLTNFIPYQAIQCQLYGHDNRVCISQETLINIHSILLNTRLQATPISTSPANLCENIYLVKLSKEDERSKPACLSMFLFFNCLIKPNIYLLEDIFPPTDLSNNSWNSLLNQLFLNNDTLVKQKLLSIYNNTCGSVRLGLECDLEFVNKWSERVNDDDNELIPILGPIDISPISEQFTFEQKEITHDLVSPPTKWCQTVFHTIILISAPDSSDTFVSISDETVQVRFKSLNNHFGYTLNLWKKIDTTMSSHEICKDKIKIVLRKLSHTDWDYLTKETTKFPWLSYDWDYNPSKITPSIWTDIMDSNKYQPVPIPLIDQVIIEPDDAPSWTLHSDSLQSMPSEAYSDIEDVDNFVQ